MKPPKLSLLIIGIFCTFWGCFVGKCQDKIVSEFITTEKGLSQGMIFDVLEDRDGFLWIATKDGLNRYDGNTFKVFTNNFHNPWSISSNTISKLFEDSRGRIWVLTQTSGINVFDKKTGRFYHLQHKPHVKNSLSGNQIVDITEGKNGAMFVGIAGGWLNEISFPDEAFTKTAQPKIQRYKIPNGYEAMGLACNSDGEIWIGTHTSIDFIIYSFDQRTKQITKAHQGASFIECIKTKDGVFGVADTPECSLIYWDQHKMRNLFRKPFGASDIDMDKDSTLWLTCYDGLFSVAKSEWKKAVQNDNYEPRWKSYQLNGVSPTLNSISIDQSNNIWAGTTGYGVRKINIQQFYFKHLLEGRSLGLIFPYNEKEFIVILGSLHVYPQLKRLDYLLKSKHEIFGVCRTSQSNFLFFVPLNDKCELKEYNLDERRLVRTYFLDHFKAPACDAMLKTSDGKIWLPDLNGVIHRFDPETGKVEQFQFTAKDNPLTPKSLCTTLYEDKNHHLWIGTEFGFAEAIPLNKHQYKFKWYSNKKNALSYNHVTCFLDDPYLPDRYLWISTKGGGINRLDKLSGEFFWYNMAQGLPNDVVYGILNDEMGNIWGSTNMGLFCLSQADGKFSIKNFTRADGLQDNEFNTGSYAKLMNGELAFGGINGLNIFDPKKAFGKQNHPKVLITDVLVNNRQVLPGDKTGLLKSTIETCAKLKLNHQQDILTLEFSSLDLSAPQHNKYRYQLVGLDPRWVESGTRRSATYLHLPAGHYTFKVQGSDGHGIWSSKMASLQIQVLPPWWLSWWAYLLYFSSFVLAFRIYLRSRIQRAQLREQLGYEAREAERLKELDSLKTKLYTNITHEFRTPLTIILGMAQNALDDPKNYFHEGLSAVIRNGKQLLNLVNQMLDLSKLEVGKMGLQIVHDDVVKFIRYILESFQSWSQYKNIQLHFLSDEDTIMMDYDAEKIRQIVSNLLSNAFKFTPEGGHVYLHIGISCAQEKEGITINVQDTGIGIAPQYQPYVFDRFFQIESENDTKSGGTGIGLALTKELVKFLGGDITVKSPVTGKNCGAEFKVFLPLVQKSGSNNSESLHPSVEFLGSTKLIRTDTAKEKKQVIKDAPLVLIVEDNEDVIAYLLACLPMYRVLIAKNGQEGLTLAFEQTPNLIISDVMMPLVNGFEFCQRLKKDERCSHIPIILLTAKADFESKLEGLDLGADVYMEKPFEKAELLIRIKKLLELRQKLHLYYRSTVGLSEKPLRAPESQMITQTEDAFIKKVRESIEGHLSDFNFSIDQLSKDVHLSQSQLNRKLDALIGMSAIQFIRELRLKHSKILLQNPDLSITAIAFDCGFNDPGYFARIFKQNYGKTPQEWRSSKVQLN